MTLLGTILLVCGVLLMVIAALGVVRLKDPLQRMHSATKAGTLGTTLVVVAAYLLAGDVRPLTVILTIVFLLFTLPIGAQLLGRASYLSGVKLEGVEGDPISELERSSTPIGSDPEGTRQRRTGKGGKPDDGSDDARPGAAEGDSGRGGDGGPRG